MTIPQHITAAIRSGKFTYCGEAQLSNFGETARKGQYVEFFLDDGPDGNSGNPFKGLSTGREKGQRFGLIAVPLGDDDAVAASEPKERTRSQWAGIRCSDPEFQKWLCNNTHEATVYRAARSAGREVNDTELTALLLREHLVIQSRKELDSNPAKGVAWDRLENQFLQDTGRMAERTV